jgi:predicted kinase
MSQNGMNFAMPKLLMLSGIPTSGKSTYVKQLKKTEEWRQAVVLSTDDYIEGEAMTLCRTYNEIFEETIQEAQRALEQDLKNAIRSGLDLVWDQTNLTSKIRKKKLKIVPRSYTRECAYFITTLEEALKRNKTRDGKFIPESVLKQMHSQFETPTINEGFYDVKEIKV